MLTTEEYIRFLNGLQPLPAKGKDANPKNASKPMLEKIPERELAIRQVGGVDGSGYRRVLPLNEITKGK
jgi:hypothetical protein